MTVHSLARISMLINGLSPDGKNSNPSCGLINMKLNTSSHIGHTIQISLDFLSCMIFPNHTEYFCDKVSKNFSRRDNVSVFFSIFPSLS